MRLVQRVAAILLGLVFVAAVLVFASIALGVLLAVGLVAWGWLWWRTRSLRPPKKGGIVVEGEYRNVTPRERLEERRRP